MKFIDTSFLIDFLRDKISNQDIIDDLEISGPHITNTIVQFEFLSGGYGSKRKDELNAREKLLQNFIIFPIDEKTAVEAAKISAELKDRGEMIGSADLLIIGTMKSNNIDTILTGNSRHFNRVEGLKVVTWK